MPRAALLVGGGLAALAANLALGLPWLAAASLLLAALGGTLAARALLRRFMPARSAAGEAPHVAPPDPSLPLRTITALIERLPDPFLLLDATGRVVLANPGHHAIIAAAAPGRHVSSVLRAPGLLEAVARVLEGRPAQVVEFSSLVPHEQHFSAFVAPVAVRLPEAEEDQRGAMLVLHDLTAVKRAEQMRADFIANASHELRTPLASLAGFIETLRGHAKDDPKARERFLEIMHAQARRMARLIEDLLSLSRIELNEHIPPEGVVDLAKLVRSVLAGLEPIAQEEGVRLDMAAEGPLAPVVGDWDELTQVVQNLVDNAIKYGYEGKRVVVSLGLGRPEAISASRGELAFVAVRDFGPGIAREHVPRLTERFYRVDAKRSRERGGTGLGLAIVKHIVNRHRGALAIQSKPGDGTTVTVHLPLAAAGAGEPPSVAVTKT